MSEVCCIWDTHPRQETQLLVEIIVHLWTLKKEASIISRAPPSVDPQKGSFIMSRGPPTCQGLYSFLCIIATAAIPEERFDLLLQETDFYQEFQELRSSTFLSLWCEIPPHFKLMTLVCFAHHPQYIFLSGPTQLFFPILSRNSPF